MTFPMKILYGQDFKTFMEFKNNFPKYSDKDVQKIYAVSDHGKITRETDLNTGCINFILNNLVGDSVLDIGCGTGFLCNLIESKGKLVTGADFVIGSAKEKYPNINFVETGIEKTVFTDNQFDTVISAHTIEHIKNPQNAINELRRICSRQLIVILPCQRPYRYTFDLHVNFFPYEYDVLRALDPPSGNYSIQKIQGDWVYHEKL
tara:strand:- start:222 stop:836 length:615 start_codon:yes stop_codon:yes gene_type:complete